MQVAEELSILSQYFSGDAPLYRVEAAGANCFRLLLYRAMPLPPYGDAAQFCFDTRDGRDDAVRDDHRPTAAIARPRERITTTVTEADFDR